MDWLELSSREPPQLRKIFAALAMRSDPVREQQDCA